MKKTVSMSLLCALSLVAGLTACKKAKDAETAAEAEVELTRPPAPSGTMSLQGYYSLAGPVGSFEVCVTGQRWRISQEGDYAALEKAYRESSVAPGGVLLVEVEGGIDARPSPDRAGTETMLIVARFVGSSPGKVCPGRQQSSKVRDSIASKPMRLHQER